MIAFKKNRTRIVFLILKKPCFWNKKNSARTIFLKLAHFTHFKITGKCEVLKNFTEGNTRKIHLFLSM